MKQVCVKARTCCDDPLDDVRGRVADADHGDAGGQVDQRVAVDVDEHAAAGRLDEDRQRGADALRDVLAAPGELLLETRAGDRGDEPALLGQAGAADGRRGRSGAAVVGPEAGRPCAGTGRPVIGHGGRRRSAAGWARELLVATSSCSARPGPSAPRRWTWSGPTRTASGWSRSPPGVRSRDLFAAQVEEFSPGVRRPGGGGLGPGGGDGVRRGAQRHHRRGRAAPHAGRPRRRATPWRWPTRSRSSSAARWSLARAAPGQIVPVDSEHSALAQCLRGGRAEEVRRLVLTASGGPFRGPHAATSCTTSRPSRRCTTRPGRWGRS